MMGHIASKSLYIVAEYRGRSHINYFYCVTTAASERANPPLNRWRQASSPDGLRHSRWIGVISSPIGRRYTNPPSDASRRPAAKLYKLLRLGCQDLSKDLVTVTVVLRDYHTACNLGFSTCSAKNSWLAGPQWVPKCVWEARPAADGWSVIVSHLIVIGGKQVCNFIYCPCLTQNHLEPTRITTETPQTKKKQHTTNQNQSKHKITSKCFAQSEK